MSHENEQFEKVIRIWTDRYFNQKLTAIQKRLYDWWVSEGFFYVSSFKENEFGTSAELMLLMGESADNLLAKNEFSASNITDKVVKKKNDGWDMISFKDKYYILKDTKENRTRVKALLAENIRTFAVKRFCAEEVDGQAVLKSVIIEIKRKAEAQL